MSDDAPAVAVNRFETESKLIDYLDSRNDKGLTADVPVMDSKGYPALCCLQAPGGDGWAVAYYGVTDPDVGEIVGDEGGWVKPLRAVGDRRDTYGWEPTWPVYALVKAGGE